MLLSLHEQLHCWNSYSPSYSHHISSWNSTDSQSHTVCPHKSEKPNKGLHWYASLQSVTCVCHWPTVRNELSGAHSVSQQKYPLVFTVQKKLRIYFGFNKVCCFQRREKANMFVTRWIYLTSNPSKTILGLLWQCVTETSWFSYLTWIKPKWSYRNVLLTDPLHDLTYCIYTNNLLSCFSAFSHKTQQQKQRSELRKKEKPTTTYFTYV